jgi:hypothetical protein
MEDVRAELLKDDRSIDAGKSKLIGTRREIYRGWNATASLLLSQGKPELAAQIRSFLSQLAAPATEREQLSSALNAHARSQHAREVPASR